MWQRLANPKQTAAFNDTWKVRMPTMSRSEDKDMPYIYKSWYCDKRHKEEIISESESGFVTV